MEMGPPPSVASSDGGGTWISGRQFTGRIVTVSNSMIFDDPVYNYSRDFPVIWEEMRILVTYACDRGRAEEIFVGAARRHTQGIILTGTAGLEIIMRRFTKQEADLDPRVFYRITDNRLELAADPPAVTS